MSMVDTADGATFTAGELRKMPPGMTFWCVLYAINGSRYKHLPNAG